MTTSTLVNNVKVVSQTVGTGTLTLGANVEGYAGIADLINGATYSYSVHQDALWEYGRGVFNATSGTLTRGVLRSFDGTVEGTSPVALGPGASIAVGVLLVEDLSERVGIPANFTIGTVTDLPHGTPPYVHISGTTPNFVLDIGLEAGPTGDTGATPTFTIGTITTLSPGASATATLTGTPPAYVLNLGIPAGATGPAGPTPVITIGTITAGAAAVTVTGTAANPILNFVLQTGATGATGGVGSPGYTSTDTWAHLNAITPAGGAGSAGFAIGPDTGTHTDANGATLVPNTGQFTYQTSPAGWIRIGAALGPTDAASLADLQNAGGNKNLWPDPYWMETTLAGGYRGSVAESPFTITGAFSGIVSAPAASPYPFGKVLVRPNANVTVPSFTLYFERVGLAVGDVFQTSFEMAFQTSGTDATKTYITGQFLDRNLATVGSSFNVIVATSANPMTTAYKAFNSGDITIPAGAAAIKFSTSWIIAGLPDWGIASVQVTKGAALPKPVQRLLLPEGNSRIKMLESHDPAAVGNGVLLRRTTYASAAAASLVGTAVPQSVTFTATGGFGQSYLVAACPATGFNIVAHPWTWTPSTTNGPARIYVVVRACLTGTNPLAGGKTLAWGWIDTDPASGSAGSEPVQLFAWDGERVPTVPITVDPTLLTGYDLFSISAVGVTAAGGVAAGMSIQYGSFSNADPALSTWRFPGLPGGLSATWGNPASPFVWLPTLLLATSPVTATKTPSAAFAAAIGQYLDEAPALDCVPAKIWNVVGMETWLYWMGMQQRAPDRTDFTVTYSFAGTYPSNPSGQFDEGICIKETASGTKSLSIAAAIGDVNYANKTLSVVTALNTAGAGSTVRFLGLGSSLMQNANIQTNLLQLVADTSINPGGAATGMNIVNVGTVGSAPNLNEGRSGQGTGIYFTAGDKFYNGGTFDFSNYVTTYLAGVPPTHVMLGDPFWDVGSATTDAAATTAATGAAGRVQLMINSIAAYNTANGTTIKTLVWCSPTQPRFGQDGEARSLTGISQRRRTRNLKIAAKVYAATFAGMEASRVYVVGLNVVGNPDTSVARYQWAPRNPGVRAVISTTHGPYSDYATMVAAASVIADGEIVSAGTDYWVKMGAGSTGGFRQAIEIDGFVRRIIDSTHGYPGRECAQQVFACMKNNP